MEVNAEKLANALLEATNNIVAMSQELAKEREKSELFYKDCLDAKIEIEELKAQIAALEGEK